MQYGVHYSRASHTQFGTTENRWAAAALLMTEQNFCKIMGYRDLWMLKAALDENEVLVPQEVA